MPPKRCALNKRDEGQSINQKLWPVVRRQVSISYGFDSTERKISVEKKEDESIPGSASKDERKRPNSFSSLGRKFSPQKMSYVLETAAVEAQKIMAWPWRQTSFSSFTKNEGSKDPKAEDVAVQQRMSLQDFSEHHNARLCSEGKSRKKSGANEKIPSVTGEKLPRRPATPPGRKVQFILGPDYEGSGHSPHPVFCEMEQLVSNGQGDFEWKETARWVKFEEDVEDNGNRWSKPHVATLSLHSLMELRNLLTKGAILLDMDASSLDDIADLLLDSLVNSNVLPFNLRGLVKDALMKKKSHLFESVHSKENLFRSFTDHSISSSSSKSLFGQDLAFKKRSKNQKGSGEDIAGSNSSVATQESTPRANVHFMKKLPKDAEAGNILIGELDGLVNPVSAFIRLNKALHLGDLTEVPLPTRFIFILLGPPTKSCNQYKEIGRSIATCFTDEVFRELAYKANTQKHIISGIDEFLDSVTVIPPGAWDPTIRIEPPVATASQDARKNPQPPLANMSEDELREKSRADAGLVLTKRFCGGLINDIKRKAPFYGSDFLDALSLQCLASVLFMYFAVLAPVVTFGGLLGEATENHISVIECLLGSMAVGVAYGLFSGQPLSILGPTGPILVYEAIMYELCRSFGWEYLSFRLSIGLWVAIILLIFVATDVSAVVCYITRFTEENFALLIAVIFIKSAIEKVVSLGNEFPLHQSECVCDPINPEEKLVFGTDENFLAENFTYGYNKFKCSFVAENGSVIHGWQTQGCHYQPNVWLASVLLFIGTFAIVMGLKQFRTSSFFSNAIRGFLADFAVIIAMVTMTGVDVWLNVATPKLQVPSNFAPTISERNWLVHPIGNNPWWSTLFAFFPALLATILVFMDQQITVVIVNRKEHLLKKGCGYHLDLLVVAVMIVVCSMFGMPWCEASTVPSINHVKSLTLETESAAPGEKPRFLGIREQRVTHVAIFILIGLSVFMAPMLTYIPMPVLFGLFLFMGVTSLNGLQMFDRLCLFLMPEKYQPDLTYLRRVPLSRVNLFTLIQLVSLIGLWVIMDTKKVSIMFPIMLVVMMGIRKLLEYLFTESELRILDDILPSMKRKEQLDSEDKKSLRSQGKVRVTMANGNVMTIPIDATLGELPDASSGINITEELTRTSVWKSLPGNGKKIRAACAPSRKDSFSYAEESCNQHTADEDSKYDSVSSPA